MVSQSLKKTDCEVFMCHSCFQCSFLPKATKQQSELCAVAVACGGQGKVPGALLPEFWAWIFYCALKGSGLTFLPLWNRDEGIQSTRNPMLLSLSWIENSSCFSMFSSRICCYFWIERKYFEKFWVSLINFEVQIHGQCKIFTFNPMLAINFSERLRSWLMTGFSRRVCHAEFLF